MNSQRGKIGLKVALFILNPFLSAINSLKNIRDGFSHRFLYLWFLIFGIAFCANNEAADSSRYVNDFVIEHSYMWEDYVYKLQQYWSFESNIKDIYTLSVNFFVGRFSDNYHWVFFIYAIVFGFFYIKSLRIFIRCEQTRSNIMFYLLLFLFCYSNPIFNINGVRFWTASWIAVYATLKIVVDRRYIYILLLAITPLVHGTFPIWIVALLVALLTSRFHKIWQVLFVVASFVTAVSFLDLLNDYSDKLPQFMQNQIWSYTQSELAQQKISGVLTEKLPLYAQIFNALPGYFILVLSYIIVFNRRIFVQDELSKRLYQAVLVLSTITNFLSAIPSVGRFKSLVIPLIVILWSLNHERLRRFDRLFYFIPLLYCYSLLYWYRNMTSVTELWLYVLPTPAIIINYLCP